MQKIVSASFGKLILLIVLVSMSLSSCQKTDYNQRLKKVEEKTLQQDRDSSGQNTPDTNPSSNLSPAQETHQRVSELARCQPFPNHNPFGVLSLKKAYPNKQIEWLGSEGPDGGPSGHAKFEHQSFGVRAGIMNMQSYLKKGWNTPFLVSKHWPPQSKQVSWLNAVTSATGWTNDHLIEPDEVGLMAQGIVFAEQSCTLGVLPNTYQEVKIPTLSPAEKQREKEVAEMILIKAELDLGTSLLEFNP